jgi:hypothetical protein
MKSKARLLFLVLAFGQRWVMSLVMTAAITLLSLGSVQLGLLLIRLVTAWFGSRGVDEALKLLC